ncbi:MAG: DUF2066 domain-containing protein [Gammaproteobacteria bacterium]|nr:DUF2066 domain-containing protein [Gammaproteobacteria bacterium]MDH5778037.1 DUF2066 domain-containing protein [Gammaproteobacteria bacterium]
MTLINRFCSYLPLAFLLLNPAHAEVVKDLYEAIIPVENQSKETRQEALREGLVQVLIKVSGSTKLILGEDPVVEMALERPNTFIQQFRYRSVQARTLSSTQSRRTERVLWIKFDEKAVNKLLRNNGQAVWGRTRPTTLAWVVVADKGERKLLNAKDKHAAIEVIENYAKERGLPIKFPLMDLTDRSKVSLSDIWGNFEGPILQASERYRPEAVLVGRLYKGVSGSWTARWSIYQDGRREDADMDGEQLTDAINPVIGRTAEVLKERFAVVATEESTNDVILEVKGVATLAQYNKVVNYLNSLTVVSKVQPYKVASNSAGFRLTTQSGRLDVAQAVELGRMLTVSPHPVQLGETKTLQPDLVYQLKQ